MAFAMHGMSSGPEYADDLGVYLDEHGKLGWVQGAQHGLHPHRHLQLITVLLGADRAVGMCEYRHE